MRAALSRRVTSMLSRVFGSIARSLAARRSISLQQVFVDELFRGMGPGGPAAAADATAMLKLSELVLDKWRQLGGSPQVLQNVSEVALGRYLDRAGGAADIRRAAETLLNMCAERTGGYTGSLGLDNEPGRAKWVEQMLKELPAGLRLLDAGAGEQQYRKHCTHLSYVSQDFAQYDGAGNQTGLQTGAWDYGHIDIVSDICSIPEHDGSFDAILCTEVFEHIPDPLGAIAEFSRLLKSGGRLILTAPFASLTHFAPHFYYTGFSRFFYEAVLRDKGFTNISITESGGYFDYLSQELHRLPAIAERYAAGPLSGALRKNAWLLQETLACCAAQDSGSKELLCYGLHVTADRM